MQRDEKAADLAKSLQGEKVEENQHLFASSACSVDWGLAFAAVASIQVHGT